MVKDPNEFFNLASDTKYTAVKRRLRAHLPKSSRKPVPGSARRVLIYENGVANWEGEDIDPNAPVPD